MSALLPLPPLLPHQEIAKDFIVCHPFSGVWLQVGGAKTRVALTALSEIRPVGHILVVAPLAIARSSWQAEIDRWGFNLRTHSLIVDEKDRKLTREKRLALIAQIPAMAPAMWFINKDLVGDLVDAMPTRQYGQVTSIQWPFPTVIIDESQDFKNPSSVRFKALAKVRPAITRMIQLTGTPTPQSLLDVWSQIYLLDGGASLGHHYTEYRQRYFFPTKHINNRPVDWVIKVGAEKIIHERIKHLVLSAKTTSLNLPPITFENIEVTLPPKAFDRYREFRREQVLDLASPDPANPSVLTITADNAAILRGKLLQFASGTVYTGANHDKDFAQEHTAKLEKLAELISPLAQAGSPVMVAYRYRADANLIPQHLRQHNIQAEVFDGSANMIERWNAQQIPVLVLQPASYGRGLNLQFGSSELIWFTLPDSLEQWIQTNGRLHRLGQTKPVRVRSLVTRNTVDEKQPALLTRKRITQDNLLEAVRLEIRKDLADCLADELCEF